MTINWNSRCPKCGKTADNPVRTKEYDGYVKPPITVIAMKMNQTLILNDGLHGNMQKRREVGTP